MIKVGDLVRLLSTRYGELFVVTELGDEWAHLYSLEKQEPFWEKIELLEVIDG